MNPDSNAGHCSRPVLPANAINITVDREEINGTYPPGAWISLLCENGYRAFTAFCQADRSWSQDYRCASNNITSFYIYIENWF